MQRANAKALMKMMNIEVGVEGVFEKGVESLGEETRIAGRGRGGPWVSLWI
jgi:hypothetical protein